MNLCFKHFQLLYINIILDILCKNTKDITQIVLVKELTDRFKFCT